MPDDDIDQRLNRLRGEMGGTPSAGTPSPGGGVGDDIDQRLNRLRGEMGAQGAPSSKGQFEQGPPGTPAPPPQPSALSRGLAATGQFGKEFAQGAATGPPSTFQHTADALRGFLAEHIPAYQQALTAQNKAWAAATPDQRRTMTPAYFGEAPEIQKAETPPNTRAGRYGFGAEQMAEQVAAGAAMPEVEGAGLLRGGARILGQGLSSGAITGAQTGDPKAAAIGAGLGMAGQGVSEYAGAAAPRAAERAMEPISKKVGLAEREELAKRAVQPGSVVPMTRDEVKAGFPSLKPEIDRNKALIDKLTKDPNSIYSQRTVPIDQVLQSTDRYIKRLGRSEPEAAAALAKKRDVWAEQLGYRPAQPAQFRPGRPATPPTQVPTGVLDANGNMTFRTVRGQPAIPAQMISPAVPAQTETTVAKLQQFKEDFRLGTAESTRGDVVVPVGAKTGRQLAERGMKRGIEKAIPEEHIKDINHIIERDLRLKDLITAAVKRNPKWLAQSLPYVGGEAGMELVNKFMSDKPRKEHGGAFNATEALLAAGFLATAATKNPRAYTRLLIALRNAGMAPAAAGAFMRSQMTPTTGPGGSSRPVYEEPVAQPAAAAPKASAPQAALPPPSGWKPEWSGMMADVANKVGVPLDMMNAMGQQESGGTKNPATVRSPKGAIGLMQIMPDTGRQYGMSPKDLEDPQKNMWVAAHELKKLIGQYGLDHKDRVLAAYNYGAGNLHKAGFNIADWPRETQGYVTKILGQMRQMAGGLFSGGEAPAPVQTARKPASGARKTATAPSRRPAAAAQPQWEEQTSKPSPWEESASQSSPWEQPQ